MNIAADESCALIIFGASGDLTKRKLLPALWSMFQSRVLPEPFAVIGVARSPMDNEEFRSRMREAVTDFARVQPPTPRVWDRFAQALFYFAGDPADPAIYPALEEYVRAVERERGTGGNRLFYVSTPPSLYPHLVARLGEAGFNRAPDGTSGWVRIVIEKPFGRDLASSRALNQVVASAFSEDQVYRIDHYLGKETVQNVLVFRWANGIFEPLWNRNHVDHVQITVGETIGVEARGAYYEEAGALRDMIQNHLLQLLCLVAMEPPVTFDADPVRDEKTKVMRAIRPIRRRRGGSPHGSRPIRPRLRQRAARAGLPRGAGRLAAVHHRDVRRPRAAGRQLAMGGCALLSAHRQAAAQARERDRRAVQAHAASRLPAQSRASSPSPISSSCGSSRTKGCRSPSAPSCRDRSCASSRGDGLRLRPVPSAATPPEAYERLLLDAMKGDATLYARGDWVDLAWELLGPVLERWAVSDVKFPNYEAGTWGPAGGRHPDRARRPPLAAPVVLFMVRGVLSAAGCGEALT